MAQLFILKIKKDKVIALNSSTTTPSKSTTHLQQQQLSL